MAESSATKKIETPPAEADTDQEAVTDDTSEENAPVDETPEGEAAEDEAQLGASDIQSRFDEVLTQHLRRLMEIDSDRSISFDLVTIASILLLVERENEIKEFASSPPLRYTRDSFLEDIKDLGLELNDDMIASIQTLTQYGYVDMPEDGNYHAQLPAFALVNFLDTLFPEMPGMNFVAYVLQSVEEVVSGRCALEEAIKRLDKTLHTRGVPLSQLKLEAANQRASLSYEEMRKRAEALRKQEAERKQANLKRLSKIRSRLKSDSSDPAIVTKRGLQQDVEIRDLFPKAAPDKPAPKTDDLPKEPPADIAPADEPEELPATDQAPVDDTGVETAPVEAPEPEPQDTVDSATVAGETAQDQIPPAPPKQAAVAQPEQPAAQDPPPPPEPPKIVNEDAILEKIKAFEDDLASTCPICKDGKIRSGDTEKGKTYYYCSQEGCRFISWGKPYHYTCPKCENAFLIEYQRDDLEGLKCPRATCNYKQDNLDNPAATAADAATKPKKKRRRVVKRRLVRRKR